MQFLTSLFGGAENAVLGAILALGIVLVLIVFGLWALKLLMRATDGVGRGRGRRLIVIESAQVDQKRRLMIVRRDDVEHLILTGGPQDVVVESGIPVERPTLPGRRVEQPAAPVAPEPADKARRIEQAAERLRADHPVLRRQPAIIPMNPAPTDVPVIDSATSSGTDGNGRTRLAGRRFRNGLKAEGN